MSERSVSFAQSLVARFPSLKEPLEEHAQANGGEILPHVFLGEVTRYALSLLSLVHGSANLGRRRELREMLDYLEEVYARGDEELRELISVSFLENLPLPDEEGAQIRDMVGQNLKKQLRMIERPK